MSAEKDIPLDELRWSNPEWIQVYGLRSDNVLDYFAESPFFDRTSNNQVLKMQTQYSEHLQGRQLDLNAELQNMKGIEFNVIYARDPDFWVIRKQMRLGRDEVRSLSVYHIIGPNIYVAPNVQSVVSSRLLTTVLSLRNALSEASSLVKFSPSQGYSYIQPEKPITNILSTAVQTQTPSQSIRTMSNTPVVTPGSGVTTPQDTETSAAVLDQLLTISLKHPAVILDDLPTQLVGSMINEKADVPYGSSTNVATAITARERANDLANTNKLKERRKRITTATPTNVKR